ncbi:glycoside hydrolase family 16 protein [Pontibacter qinzhouensis]|uniref:Glycoside hydrolase family 16 protein n=1 Tax=Pontibacter qinzhouensis TaxID=2603253 RepID=A0A5C8J2Q6_9BACT|nr:glycoside hydrolase family 16 protein [Pontibacter qinzhouensis]TXK28404.1 glycoside hydrolase family 16 protein [Pontibacter qinzhouensis]
MNYSNRIALPKPFYAFALLGYLCIGCTSGLPTDSAGTAATTPATAQPATAPTPEAFSKLVWSDEFDSPNLDTSKWEMEVGDKWHNNELQAYTNRATNAFTKDGFLVIEAKQERLREANYTSARLRTKGKGDWQFGKVEVRAKLPSGQGIWPAIWMMPTDDVYGGWPKSGELDIMELRGKTPNQVLGTIHYGTTWPGNKNISGEYDLPTGTFSDDFHIFSITWSKDLIRWYVDGQQFYEVTPETIAPEHYPYNSRFYLILNLAVGGDFGGNPDTTTTFPQQMLVDYARVYKLPEEDS